MVNTVNICSHSNHLVSSFCLKGSLIQHLAVNALSERLVHPMRLHVRTLLLCARAILLLMPLHKLLHISLLRLRQFLLLVDLLSLRRLHDVQLLLHDFLLLSLPHVQFLMLPDLLSLSRLNNIWLPLPLPLPLPLLLLGCLLRSQLTLLANCDFSCFHFVTRFFFVLEKGVLALSSAQPFCYLLIILFFFCSCNLKLLLPNSASGGMTIG